MHIVRTYNRNMVIKYLWITIIVSGIFAVAIADDDDDDYFDDDDDDDHRCDDRTRVVAHNGECQLYYDCRFTYRRVPHLFEQHMRECPYLFLFSKLTKQCEWFEDVDCGKRKEPISGCDHRANRHPRGRPCRLDFPHCDNMRNGANVIESKLFTSSYAVCYKGRFLFEDTCPNDALGKMQIFDPNTLTCISSLWKK